MSVWPCLYLSFLDETSWLFFFASKVKGGKLMSDKIGFRQCFDAGYRVFCRGLRTGRRMRYLEGILQDSRLSSGKRAHHSTVAFTRYRNNLGTVTLAKFDRVEGYHDAKEGLDFLGSNVSGAQTVAKKCQEMPRNAKISEPWPCRCTTCYNRHLAGRGPKWKFPRMEEVSSFRYIITWYTSMSLDVTSELGSGGPGGRPWE
jgi:hypothetical protein